MSQGRALHRFLYLSRLAAHANFSVFGSIVAVSRAQNRERGIASVLLFDGERFCQWLEGGPAAVQALAQRIERDPRHRDFTVLHRGQADDDRLHPDWRGGYCGADDLDIFEGAAGLRGPGSVFAFLAIAARADLSF
jgi:hypothetical protein